MLEKIRAMRPEYQSTAYLQGFLTAMLFTEAAKRTLDAGKPLDGKNLKAALNSHQGLRHRRPDRRADHHQGQLHPGRPHLPRRHEGAEDGGRRRTGSCSSHAQRAPPSGTPRGGAGHGARRANRRHPRAGARADGMILEVNNIEVIYNKVVQVLRGLSLAVPRGQIVALLGSNGAGKTHHAEGRLGPAGAGGRRGDRRAASRFDGQRHRGSCAPHQLVRAGLFHVMEGRQRVRGPDGRRKPGRRHLCADRAQCAQRRLRPGLRLLPAPARAAQGPGRLPVGRRAADAGHRPRADRAAAADPARRTLAGPVADAGGGHLRHHRAHQRRAGRRRCCWSSRTPPWRWPWRTRLHHGDRQGRDRRHRREAGRRPRRARVLPGHGRRRRGQKLPATSSTTSAASAGCHEHATCRDLDRCPQMLRERGAHRSAAAHRHPAEGLRHLAAGHLGAATTSAPATSAWACVRWACPRAAMSA